jgi:hypothetical protein
VKWLWARTGRLCAVSLGTVLENINVEVGARAEPGDVVGVVREIIAGVGVEKNSQAFPVDHEPRYEVIEHRRIEGNLITPARVRPDHLLVPAAHAHVEALFDSLTQPLRFITGFGVELDVRVVVLDVCEITHR